jgi:outer membrane protein OmpA-like peptidoglycan-associated protein
MYPSFAHFRPILHVAAVGLALSLSACASLPPPTAELDAASQAVARADAADADQYAHAQLEQARAGLEHAQAAMAKHRDDEVRSAALSAAADADLAYTLSRTAVTRAAFSQKQSEIAELRKRLQMPPEAPIDNPLDFEAPASPAELRLQALDADPRLNPFAQYERLQARQALAALQASSSRNRSAAALHAERRVAIAEQAARIEAAQRVTDTLQGERSDLLVEASRRDAERARADAERLRIEAQVQAEEAARLRATADAESSARLQAEAVLDSAQVDQGARVTAAREKEAALARQEAELVAGAKLPPSRQSAGGVVFTLDGDAFGSGQASLTSAAAARVRALGVYLKSIKEGRVQIVGHTDSQGEAVANKALSLRRAEAVRACLVDAGLPRNRTDASGQGQAEPITENVSAAGRARNRRVEIIVSGNP